MGRKRTLVLGREADVACLVRHRPHLRLAIHPRPENSKASRRAGLFPHPQFTTLIHGQGVTAAATRGDPWGILDEISRSQGSGANG